MPYKFIATDAKGNPTAIVPGVPARDLTDEEWAELTAAGLIVEGEPSATLWEHEGGGVATIGRARANVSSKTSTGEANKGGDE
jgi:hypothetical protein